MALGRALNRGGTTNLKQKSFPKNLFSLDAGTVSLAATIAR
jgi:hypothetical protein